MMNMMTMETAPRSGQILVYAQWAWAARPDDVDDEFEYRVAEWYDGEFHSVTSNPYMDIAINPTHWAELPK